MIGERTAKLTGHATKKMLEHYANHADENDFSEALSATSRIFGELIDNC